MTTHSIFNVAVYSLVAWFAIVLVFAFFRARRPELDPPAPELPEHHDDHGHGAHGHEAHGHGAHGHGAHGHAGHGHAHEHGHGSHHHH